MRELLRYLDKLEDRIRGRLSRYPIIYSLIGGAGIVLFWRGVWITADEIAKALPGSLIWLDGPISVAVSLLLLLTTGLFVSFFISDQIILSGINRDKKIVEKTESEVREEGMAIKTIQSEVETIEKEVRQMRNELSKKRSKR
jgi:hypothetical protein